jgi:hypothetical protein
MITPKASNAPKPFVFVLMPFSVSFRDTYELGIRQACYDAGAYCERVDEQYFDGSIVDRIYNQIAKADVIVSDMTGRNPNVFYETGYAHALGKRTILLTQSNDDIPFDLKHYTHVIYNGSIVDLKNELRPKIEWAISNPAKEVTDPLSVLTFHLAGKELSEGALYRIPVMYEASENLLATSGSIPLTTQMQVNVQNHQNRTFDASTIQIAVEMPSLLASPLKAFDAIQVREGISLILLKQLGYFLPYSWQNLSIQFPNRTLSNFTGDDIDFVLHVFTELGKREVSFKVIFEDMNHRVK